MSNRLTVNFIPCETQPKDGYSIYYRPVGSSIPYRNGGKITASPAVIVDSSDADGANYEGYIQANGTQPCNQVPFSTATATNHTGTVTNTQGSNTGISGIFFGRYIAGADVPNDYYPIAVDGGYYVNPGETRNATVNEKYNNTVSNLIVYLNPSNPFLGVRVVDSDGATHCLAAPNEGFVIMFFNIRLSNVDGFSITLLSTPC